jgi:hypothetical protein
MGLVWDDANPAKPIIESLRSDGQPLQNWQPGTAADMLGRPGQTENFQDVLSGRQGTLTWRYFLLAPIDFEREITAAVAADVAPGDRMVLFYAN